MENPLQPAFCSSNMEILTFRVTVVYVMRNNALFMSTILFQCWQIFVFTILCLHCGVECDYGTSTKLMALRYGDL